MNLKKSLWQKDIGQNNFKVLDKNIKTDILIIGGGITGLTSAYYLMDKKYNVVLNIDNIKNNSTINKNIFISINEEFNWPDLNNKELS